MNPPKQIESDCSILGFQITGWDEVNGALLHPKAGVFLGSHAEVKAYLLAWSACSAIRNAPGQITRTILSMAGDSPVEMKPGQSVQVTSRPQRLGFRGDRIAIPMEIAPHFQIMDIRIGSRSQTPQSGGYSGELFSTRIDRGALLRMREHTNVFTLEIDAAAEAEFGRAFAMETAQPAMDIVIVATLKDAAPRPMAFEAYILGISSSY